MKGTITVSVNNLTLLEALQDYFDKQLAADKRMMVQTVESDSGGGYGVGLTIKVTLAELAPEKVA